MEPVKSVEDMTNRELMEEMVGSLREIREIVTQFSKSMSNNPMLTSMARMFGGKKV